MAPIYDFAAYPGKGFSPLSHHFVVPLTISLASISAFGNPSKDRVRLDTQFNEQLQRLVESWELNGHQQWADRARAFSIQRDPGRQYCFVPEELIPKAEADAVAREAPSVGEDIQKLRHYYAKHLFELAGQRLKDQQPDVAYRWLHEVLHFDPRHEQARRIAGLPLVSSKASQTESGLRVRRSRFRHPRLGWAPNQYQRVETHHFQISTDASEDKSAALAITLEELYHVWRQLFFRFWSNEAALSRAWRGGKLETRTRARHRVVLFGDRQGYIDFLQQLEPRARMTLGYYHAASRTAYFFAGDTDNRSTWRHEATHQLFHETRRIKKNVGAEQNFWIVEGLALYMESLQRCGDFRTVGGIESERLQFARYRALTERFQVPFSRMVSFNQQQLQNEPRIRQLYSQAAGLTHFLMDFDRQRYRNALIQYVTEVYTGRDTVSSLPSAANVQFEQLDREYQNYLNVTDSRLAAIDRQATIRYLSLGRTNVTDEGIRSLSDLGGLTWLDLNGTAISDNAFDKLQQATQLRQLMLEKTKITDRTVMLLNRATELRELDLSGTRITDEALKTVGQLSQLRSLWLTGTNITDRGLNQLKNLKQLETLDVNDTQVTEHGLESLHNLLPELQPDKE